MDLQRIELNEPQAQWQVSWSFCGQDLRTILGWHSITKPILETGLNLLTDIFKEFDLHLSEGKTKTMILKDERDKDYPENIHTIRGWVQKRLAACGSQT